MQKQTSKLNESARDKTSTTNDLYAINNKSTAPDEFDNIITSMCKSPVINSGDYLCAPHSDATLDYYSSFWHQGIISQNTTRPAG